MFTHLNIKNKFFTLFTIKFIFVATIFVTQINGSEDPSANSGDSPANLEEIKIKAEQQENRSTLDPKTLEQAKARNNFNKDCPSSYRIRSNSLPDIDLDSENLKILDRSIQPSKAPDRFDSLVKSLAGNSGIVGALGLTLMQPFLKSLQEKLEPLQESYPNAIFYGSGTLIALVIGGTAYKFYQTEKINNLQLEKLKHDTEIAKKQKTMIDSQHKNLKIEEKTKKAQYYYELGKLSQAQDITDYDLENPLSFEEAEEKLNKGESLTPKDILILYIKTQYKELETDTLNKLKKLKKHSKVSAVRTT